MTESTIDVADARELLADLKQVPGNRIEVEALQADAVPGWLVFRGHATKKKQRTPPRWSVGATNGETVHWGADAVAQAVIEAWTAQGIWPEDPVQQARVLGFVEVKHEETRPLLQPSDWSHMKPEWASKVAAPITTTVDGHPALVYWNTSAEPPLWRTTWVFDPAGARRTTESIWDM